MGALRPPLLLGRTGAEVPGASKGVPQILVLGASRADLGRWAASPVAVFATLLLLTMTAECLCLPNLHDWTL